MKRSKGYRWLSLAAVLCLILSLSVARAGAATPTLRSSSQKEGDHIAMMFVENVGQFGPYVHFQVQADQATVYLAEDGMWFAVWGPAESFSPRAQRREGRSLLGSSFPKATAFRLGFLHANPQSRLEPFGRLPTIVSYFRGQDPANWYTDVPAWSGVRYRDLYPGLDLLIEGRDGRWQWRMVAREEAALDKVYLEVQGDVALELEGERLRFTTAFGAFSLPLPTVTGVPADKLAAPELQAARLVAHPFARTPAGGADISPAAITDLKYSSYLGGSADDEGYGIALDDSGNIYVVGFTGSANFPTVNPWDGTLGGQYDAFAVKLNPTGSSLVYATYFGGSSNDWANKLALDSTGCLYLTGATWSTDFPTTEGAYDRSHNGQSDAFVAKLGANGNVLVYSTFVGGDGLDEGYGIALDASKNAYVAGDTWPPTAVPFPTTPGAYDTSYNGASDAFVLKLNSTGTALLYSTFLGSADYDSAYDIAVDGNGNAYLTGDTTWEDPGNPSDFPTTPDAFDTEHNGHSDAFVTKLNATGSALLYSTFLGSSNNDWGEAIVVDDSGHAYVTGRTAWVNPIIPSEFPTTPSAYDTTHNGDSDIFVTKLAPDGASLVFSTFIGGSGKDAAYDLARDQFGQIFLTGETCSSDFPATLGAFSTSLNGERDAFVARMSGDGRYLLYASYLGGSDDVQGSTGEWGGSIALNADGASYLTGGAYSSDYPVKNAYDSSYNGGRDAFVTKMTTGLDGCYPLTISTNHGTVAPESDWYPIGSSRNITATAPIAGSSERYIWMGWTGSGSGSYTGMNNPATITMNSPIIETATWTHQYYLTVTTNVGTVNPSSGWKNAGSNIQIQATPPSVGAGERYLWGGWVGTGPGSYTGQNNPASITMNGPIHESASWTHQYYLTMNTNAGTVSPGSVWRNAGSNVQIQATAPVPGPGERYIWNGWTGSGSGSYTGMNNPANLTMSGPVTESASWTHECYLTVTTNAGTVTPADGWRSAGTVLQVQATPPTAGPGERYLWNGWTGTGNGSYTGLNNPATVTMNSGIREDASWTRQYSLTMSTNYGTVTPGTGWRNAGSSVQIQATAPSAGPGERYLWGGWTGSGSGSYTGSNNPATVTVNGPLSQSASWTHQYYLTVRTDPAGLATIEGEGWKDAGSNVQVGTAPETIECDGVTFTFQGWLLDDAPVAGNPISVLMDGAHTAKARYRALNNNPPSTEMVTPKDQYSVPYELVRFTGVYRDPDGWQNIRYADLLINSRLSVTNCIYVRYDVAQNKMYIRQPGDRYWMGGKAPGTAAATSHVFGKLDYAASSVVANADTLTVTWGVAFTWRNSGLMHNLYMAVEDKAFEKGGWDDRGDWLLNRMPNWLVPPSLANQAVNVGVKYTFDPRYRDLDGWGNLSVLYFAFAKKLPKDSNEMEPGGIFLKYDQVANKMYLSKADGSGWLPVGGFEPGQIIFVENEYVKVIGQWSTLGIFDAKTRIVRWRLEFKAGAKGRWQMYMRAKDLFPEYNGDTGWKWKAYIDIQ